MTQGQLLPLFKMYFRYKVMAANFIIQDKNEVLVVHPEALRERSFYQKLQDLKPSQSAKTLVVIVHSELSLIPHRKNISKTGFYHLKNIGRVRPFLSQANTDACFYLQ